MTRAIFLLPAWSRFGSQTLLPVVATRLGRADALPPGDAGDEAQRRRHARTLPAHWTPAALTRQADVGDAAGAAWLRVDPAHLRADINGARLLGVGARLGLSGEDADALLPALRPLFGDSGFALDAPVPERWYLRLPRETALPRFSDPDAALGEDLFEHQPDGADARRWRALMSEVQIVLHNHPWNARRAERGLVAINALWPWGGGALPDRCECDAARVYSDDDTLRAFARCAGCAALPLPQGFADAMNAAGREARSAAAGAAQVAANDDVVLFDLRRMRDLAALQHAWLLPACVTLREGALAALDLDSADGVRLRLAPNQRWRFWRRAWTPPMVAGGDA